MRRVTAGTRPRVPEVRDAVIAVAAVVVIAAPHLPWYVATQSPAEGNPVAPEGTATGLSGHETLWAVTVLAVVQLVLLLARHGAGGRLRVPGDQLWLAFSATAVCFFVVADADLLPGSWLAHLNIAGESPAWIWPHTYLFVADATETVTWSYGAAAAVAAALILLLASIVSPKPPATSAP
jgi:hypothetical protein